MQNSVGMQKYIRDHDALIAECKLDIAAPGMSMYQVGARINICIALYS